MTFTIDFSLTEQIQLTQLAREAGIEPAMLIKKLVAEQLPRLQYHLDETPSEELFDAWDAEYAALTVDEQVQRETVWEEFQRWMNETRHVSNMMILV